MFPILFEFPNWLPLIGGRALHTYGLMVAIAFLAGFMWIRYESKRVGLDPKKMMDLSFYIVLAAIVGSRLLYVLASVPEWWKNPLVFFQFWEGGLVFYGGLIGAVLMSLWYTRKHKIPFFTVADVVTPGIALGHAFGRLGCFSAGCCYGREVSSHSLLGVLFPHTKYSIAPWDYYVYPTQLFEVAGELLIFLILFFFRKHKKFEGEVFLIYIILYPILRSVLEIFRGDKIRGFVIEGVLSTSQFISIIWVVIAIILWTTLLRKRRV